MTSLFTEVGEMSSMHFKDEKDGKTAHGQTGVNPEEARGGNMCPAEKAAALSAVLSRAAHSKRNFTIAASLAHLQEKEVQLYVTEVEGTTSFFGQLYTDADKVREVGAQLNEMCSKARVVTNPEYNKVYAARFSQDGLWYRCKIVQKVDDNKSIIHYMDYGNSEEIMNQSGFVCLNDELALMPPLALHFRLDGLESLERDDPAIYDKALVFVDELLRDKNVKVVTSTKISRETTNMVTRCHLLDSGVDVINEVLSQGYAKKMKAKTEDVTLVGSSGQEPSDNTPVQSHETVECPVKPTVMPQWSNSKNQQQVHSANIHHDCGYQMISDTSSFLARDPNYYCGRGSSSEHNYQQGFGPGFNGGRFYSSNQQFCYSAPPFRPNYPGAEAIRSNRWFRPTFYQREQPVLMGLPKLRMVAARSTQTETLEALEAQIDSNNALCQAKDNSLSKLAHTLELLEKVRHQRGQISSDPHVKDIFEMVLEVYEECSLIAVPTHSIDTAVTRYQEAQDAIRKCNDLDQLTPLRAERDAASVKLWGLLQGHEAAVKASGQTNSSNVPKIKAALELLTNTYKDFLENCGDASLDTIPDVPLTIDELSQSFEKLKVEIVPQFQKQREKTDAARAHLTSVLQELQQALADVNPGSVGKRFSACCLDASVEELKCCLQAEVSACNPMSSASCGPLATVVPQLRTELQRRLNSASNLASTEDRYSSLLKELSLDCGQHNSEDSEQKAVEACQLQRSLRKLKSVLRHRLADLEDIEPCDEAEREKVAADIHAERIKLQGVFLEEEQLLDELSRLQKQRFPELALICPTLELPQYQKYNGLLKSQWELIAFDTEAYGPQLKTKLCAEDMTVTEYTVDATKDLDGLLMNIVRYSSTCCGHLIRIRAVFVSKDQRHVYVMVPSVGKPLLNHGQPLLNHLELLHGILIALHELHTPAKGKCSTAHGRVHPAWVVVCDDGKSMALDLPNFSVYMPGNNLQLPVAGAIDFTAPELRTLNAMEPTPASDMFAFGCLILWLLFPGAQFKHGCLENLEPADEIRNKKELPVIRSLLQENPNDRPTATQLLENPIFAAFNKKLN